jgi:hypothetical protein
MSRFLRHTLALVLLAGLFAGCGTPQGTPGHPLIVSTAPTTLPVRLIGTLNPAVTQATIRTTICVVGWTRAVRPPASYTSALERRQIRELGLSGGPADYEEDHLMPLALGGAPRDPANLRPVPLRLAKQHDQWEVRLQHEVCDGDLTLTAAQQRMSEIKEDLR